MHHIIYDSPVGYLRLVADSQGLRQLWLPNEVENRICPESWLDGKDHPLLSKVRQRLDAYFSGEPVIFNDLPLAPVGTAFRQQVWSTLNHIPYGGISSYGEIAQQINNPKAVRAVGGAVGSNPIAIILPCHRVLGKDGTLTGYSGGLTVKIQLLKIENIAYKA